MSEEKQNEEPQKDAEYYFKLGNDQFDKGDYDGAIESYNKAIELDGNDPDYFNNKGIAQNNKGDYDGAIESYNKVIKLDDSNPFYYNNRGNAQKNKGNYDDAIASYNKAIELDGSNPDYFNNKGVSQNNKGDYDGAIESNNKAIELDDSDPFYYSNRGNAQKNKGNYDDAIASYNKAIELDGNDPDYFNNKGNAQQGKGDYDDAIASYNKAIELDGSDPDYFNNKGIAQRVQGDYDDAITSLNEAIKLYNSNPNYGNPDYFFRIGNAQSNKGYAQRAKGDANEAKKDYDDAIASYIEAIKLDDENPEYYNNKGNAHYYNKDYDDAIASYSDAITRNDNEAIYYNNRGNAYSNIEEKGALAAVSDWYRSFELEERRDVKDEKAEKIYKYIVKNNISNAYGESLEMLGYMLSSASFFDVDFKNSEINKQIDNLDVDEITEKIKKSSLDTYNKHLIPLLSDLKNFENEKEYIKTIFYFLTLVKGFKKNRHRAAVKRVKPNKHKENHSFFQYTSVDVLKIFLGLNGEDNSKNDITLRLNNTNYMNDPTEGNYFLRDVLKAKKGVNKKSINQLIKELIKQDDSHAFIASLTFTKKDDIPMWNMYGRNGKGVAIGLELPDSIFEQTTGQNETMSNTSVEDQSTQTQNSFSKVSGSEKEHVDEKSLLYKIYYYGEKGGTSKNKKEADKLLKKIKCVFNDLIDVYDSLKSLPQPKNEKKNVENVIEFIQWEFDRIKFLIKDKQYQYEDEYRILRLTKDYKEAEHDQNDPRLFTKVKGVKMREVIFGAESDSASYWTPVIYQILGDDVEVRDSDTSIKF
ncbi:tetratricopeptide repeat protein [Weissella viridescens]|uniref:Tetratricopeptide repeat protein n=1 Tax=Weissella viridescens TaxID=1629 RepID=A0A3P2RMA5_WEIVI|nr:tetratricopeptide repeat protein [Weissella viridescens]RRG18628.1 tetratricopeptide repeat protein [Weissella viridescens]